jgi:hypothetical protein
LLFFCSQYGAQGHPSGSGMRGGGFDHRDQRGQFDRDPSYNRPIIGAKYEPIHEGHVASLSGELLSLLFSLSLPHLLSHPLTHSLSLTHSPSLSLADIDYLQQVRKHQQELHAQEHRREEYRMLQRQAERRQVPPPGRGPQGPSGGPHPLGGNYPPAPLRAAQGSPIYPRLQGNAPSMRSLPPSGSSAYGQMQLPSDARESEYPDDFESSAMRMLSLSDHGRPRVMTYPTTFPTSDLRYSGHAHDER